MARISATLIAFGLIALLGAAFAVPRLFGVNEIFQQTAELQIRGGDPVIQQVSDNDNSRPTVKLQVRGGEPVIQVLPGPSPFADQAMAIIEGLPDDLRRRQKQMAEDGPFTNRVVPVSGEFVATFRDRGDTGDQAEGEATFTSSDGAKWRVVIKGVMPESRHSSFEPHLGGVAVDQILHGNTGLHTPLKPKVKAVVAWWGPADVYHRGTLVARDTPAHVMLSTATRGDDFRYSCYDCTNRKMEQLHLIVPRPSDNPLPATGGFLHLSWEKSTYVRSDDHTEIVESVAEERVRIRVRKDLD
jgi:hypothetical protein